MSPNLALISIPAYYILSGLPHAYALLYASSGQASKMDNRNPRATDRIDQLRQTLSPAEFRQYERAEAAHKNSMENLPLYIGAVFAGLLVEQATKGTVGKTYVASGIETGMQRFVWGWLATRALYNVVYIATDGKAWSFARTAIYGVGVGLCFEQFFKAASILGN